MPRIDLARLATERPETTAGHRDLFRFGSATRDEDEAEQLPVPAQTPEPVPTPPVEAAYAPAPGPPQLNLKYLGSVENHPASRWRC